MLHTKSIVYAGLTVQTVYVTKTKKCYGTLSSFADAINAPRANVTNWRDRHLTNEQKIEAIEVVSGVRNKKTFAYPVEYLYEYLQYRASLGDIQAKALLKASFVADMERSIREAHNETVTPEQHEANRTTIRLDLVKKYLGTYKKGEPLDCDILGLQGVSDTDIYHSSNSEYSDFQLANEYI